MLGLQRKRTIALVSGFILAFALLGVVPSSRRLGFQTQVSKKSNLEKTPRELWLEDFEALPGVEAYRCTAKQADRQVLHFRKTQGDDSRCSAEKYLNKVHEAFPSPTGKLFVNIGANKGGVIAEIFDLWVPAPESRYGNMLLDFWLNVEKVGKENGVGPCGLNGRNPVSATQTATGGSEVATTKDSRRDSTWPHVVGVEMMVGTYEALMRGLKHVGLDSESNRRRTIQLVQRGISDKDEELFVESVQAGKEDRGEWHFREKQAELQSVYAKAASGDTSATKEIETRGIMRIQLSTFDSLARDSFKLDESLFMLIVDTEGNDPKVLESATATLAAHATAVVIFEYHSLWKSASPTHSLRKTLDSLEKIGYECFFSGEHGLWRLTNCWDDKWEFFWWSNVMCLLSKLKGSQQIIAELDLAPRYAD
uniref:Methyltransferase FkbM domain-containing protein n=1 Tax=Erythrolobus australicus TaxID=1077150 RepID=A0A7S1TLD9_9RHOD|mmetsp:Transcript_3524/g.9709  ORF Transcript_3524/g.9709 Transcript_3524/m.9709 type:complete len:423 (+) Transcript_3524:36-1304(+)